MKLLSNFESKNVTGAMAIMGGDIHTSLGMITYEDGFYVTVTGKSSNIVGNFAAYSDKVVNLSDNEVLFDGKQSSFCIDGNLFKVTSIPGGHTYTRVDNC